MQRIRDFKEEYGTDGIYVSVSGKDSRVVLDMARKVDPDIEAVYLDTWMEYPQIRQYITSLDNVTVIKPSKSMKQIIDDDGWCFPSKDIAEAVDAYRRRLKWADNKLHGLDGKGNPSKYRQRYTKWLKLAEDCPEKISHYCCLDMKERPVEKYERTTGKHPILGLMAVESARRKEAYMRTGCNSFAGNRPMSKPIGFWNENDVMQYHLIHSIDIAEPYGVIYEQGQIPGQTSMFCTDCNYKTTGEERTGCMFCPVGGHLNDFSKIERVKPYNNKLYDYLMEELGMKRLIEWVRNNYPRKA